MADAQKTLTDLKDYTHQLKRHTAGRLAFVLQFSVLEKQFRQSSYKRNIAAKLKKLIDYKGARSFSLPSTDLVMITKDASLDDIAEPMQAIHKILRSSNVISSLDPKMGHSDAFTLWFKLEEDYDAFSHFVSRLGDPATSPAPDCDAELADKPSQNGEDDSEESARQSTDETYLGPGLKASATKRLLKIHEQGDQAPIRMDRRMRILPIERPPREPAVRDLDPEMLWTLTRALETTDLEPYIRKRPIVARLANTSPATVMTHWYVPIQSILESLLGETQLSPNRWFSRYLEDMLAMRLLSMGPDLSSRDGLGASIRVSSQACLDETFAHFHASLGTVSRSEIILEFSVYDMLQAFSRFEAAHEHVTGAEYRIIIADLDIRHLPWLQFDNLMADFIKVNFPTGPISHWLTEDICSTLPGVLRKIGLGRVILTNVTESTQIDLGQELGITLFEGDGVD